MSADSASKRAGRVVVVLLGAVIAAFVGYVLFVDLPAGNLARLLGIAFAIGGVLYGARIAARIADARFPSYNVAEVAVEGPITRDGSSPLPAQPGGTPAADVVEQIERADDDDNADALLVKLNTPGGEVVPSDDIRLAAEAFDGPTVAYATDVCASGGYWIASGCDEIYAREGSVVGSIGVVGSRVVAADLADKLGLTYQRLAAGKYKDAGVPFKEMTEDERAYLQGIVDDYYETFVDRVTDGREIDEEAVRETEARVFLGPEARERGLVDEVGTRETVEDALSNRLGEAIGVREFEPSRRLVRRMRGGARSLARAVGAGAASAVVGDRYRFR